MSTLCAANIKQLARQVGFDACGMASAEAIPQFESQLREWLQSRCHASIHFMAQHVEMRANPQLLFTNARTVISVLLGYKPSTTMQGPAKIAQYAYGEDYHEQIKRMLYQLILAIQNEYTDFEARPFVDTAPISDKLWAQKAGLGWIGRNTLLVNPTMGSYCFIGELVTSSEVDVYDTPMASRCGDCHRCVEACPNGALHKMAPISTSGSDTALSPDPSQTYLCAESCTSYNTIENRAPSLPPALHLRGYAFGCDCCQEVCPYNRQAPARVAVTAEQIAKLESLSEVDETTFKKLTKHSALNRINYTQWQRNLRSLG